MHVAIVGGGVAGLSAAEALSSRGLRVDLWEAKSRLGGRAGSFFDHTSGRWIDLCQHIGLGCCTEWLDFCRRTGASDHLRRDTAIHFMGAGGRRYRFAAADMLPPPLHLAPALLRMGFLSWRERLHLARTLRALQAAPEEDSPQSETIGRWLARRGVSQQALRRFYEPVLISALGESLERASLAMSRKVFVDGFLTTRDGFHLITPTCSLTEFYDVHVARHLEQQGVRLLRGARASRIAGGRRGITGVDIGGELRRYDAVVAALPWSRLAGLLDPSMREALPWLAGLPQIEAAPISGVHLWFDRPILDLPQAAILDCLSQWIFAAPRPAGSATDDSGPAYYQVIISASHALRGRSEGDVVSQVVDELRRVLPSAAKAHLLRGRLVTEHAAVFSVRPGLTALRPQQRTAVAGLFIAGDWTATGWPATMESAVRSGRLAAEALAGAWP